MISGPCFLGLDGGGSATRWVLCGADGRVVARGELPPVSGYMGQLAVRARFSDVVAGLRAAVGEVAIAGVVAGITGLSKAEIAAGILAEGLTVPLASVEARDDMWIAYHGVFAPGAGHLVYAGTGSIGLHIAADGSVVRVGGRGMLIDDAGSGFWIGRSALDEIWRRLDADPTWRSPMADAVFAAIGGADWDIVRAYVYDGGRNAVAQLAQAVAATDDPKALTILNEAGRELARLGLALVARTRPLPVALAGRAASLHPAVISGFRAAAPELQVALASPDAALAAARLACGSARQRAG